MSDENKKSFKDLLLKNFESVQRGTEFVLKAIPKENLDFSPGSGMRTLREIAFHIATLPYTATYYVENKSSERPTPEKFKDLLAREFGQDLDKNDFASMFSKACIYFKDFYGKKSTEELVQKTFTNFIYTEETPYLSGFLSVEDHVIQHRGTMFAYLRVLGVPVTMLQYFGIEELH